MITETNELQVQTHRAALTTYDTALSYRAIIVKVVKTKILHSKVIARDEY